MKFDRDDVRTVVWLFAIASAVGGIQFVYSIQFSLGVPLFQSYQLPTSSAAIILATAGPISGFVVQPIIGAISDAARYRLGRRRPFILAGAIAAAIGLVFIVLSEKLGLLCGDNRFGQTSREHRYAIAFAIFGLWIVNIFVNMAQCPARAIISDIVPADQQHEANGVVSAVQAIASIIAYVLGTQALLSNRPFVLSFSIAGALLLLLTIPTIWYAVETDPSHDLIRPRPPLAGIFARIWSGIVDLPAKMKGVLLIFFLSWCGFAPVFILTTTYFAHVVFRSTGNFDRAVQRGMYGLAILSAVQWVASLTLSPVIRRLGVRACYLALQIVATVCYALFFVLPRQPRSMIETTGPMTAEAYALLAALGCHFAAMNAVPFALVASGDQAPPSEDAGLVMGVLNSGSVVAQGIVNAVASLLIAVTHQDVSVGMAIGAVPSLLCCFLIPYFLPGRPKHSLLEANDRSALLDRRILAGQNIEHH
jgi:solute carrier family 45 protein 1/2/4